MAPAVSPTGWLLVSVSVTPRGLSWLWWLDDWSTLLFSGTGLLMVACLWIRWTPSPRIATPDNEETLVEEALGMSAAALDRLARRHRGISEEDARTVWERRQLVRQWNLDESELRFQGRLPGVEGRIFDQAIDSRVDQMSPDAETGMFDLYQHRAADAHVDLAASGDGADGSPYK
jgi:hypothetical protein